MERMALAVRFFVFLNFCGMVMRVYGNTVCPYNIFLKSICLKNALHTESKLTEISKKVLKKGNKCVIVIVVKTLLGILNYFRVIIKVSSELGF